MEVISKLLAGLTLLAITAAASAQNLNFTYQGQLQNNGEPFTGSVDLEFELLGGPDGDISMGVDVHPGHPVSNGLFQALLSFDMAGPASVRGIPEVEMLPLDLGIQGGGRAGSPPQAHTLRLRGKGSPHRRHAC